MRRQLIPALRMVAVLTVLCGLLYPLAMTGVAQALFADEADGSLVERDGQVVGSSLVGQAFTAPEHFHTRPSSAGALASGSLVQDTDADGDPVGDPHPADPSDLSNAASGASNQGPTNADLLAAIEKRAAAYREANGLADAVPVPIDAVTASASGVDPHISIANARLQASRVADERGLPLDEVLALVDDHTERRALGFLGEEGVNVLELNLALDQLRRD
jgi:K+-transporting ATPase ATPase C chain